MIDDPSHGSVTYWIAELRDGEASSAQRELWDRYFRRIVALARAKLGALPRGPADEEDVAISAMQSLFHGFERDRFPDLCDRHNLWSLLAKITARKAINERQKQTAKKRGGGVPRLSVGPTGADDSMPRCDPSDDDLGPEFIVAMEEEMRRLMTILPDETLRRIAGRKLEGYSSAEIATELGVVERTVERKLALIRATWAPAAEV
ncbi:ECF-type sigma factor [Botrimarina mediterranea]|uniref:ECF sigma factor n=1 Tax=Botrimarina mediterranea TaxID=2528022 RepID=A0A518KBQ0_9BACT|nr:ECF-type sigma factor [Botrimarina mediterranea]QDV75221.1 ECF sigma factor [Botrimarina mediterranea]QDV79890.1 ECF sigma factor [Planctomycetes bacterium K2D]